MTSRPHASDDADRKRHLDAIDPWTGAPLPSKPKDGRPIDTVDPWTGLSLSPQLGRRERIGIDRADPVTGEIVARQVGYRARITIDREPP